MKKVMYVSSWDRAGVRVRAGDRVRTGVRVKAVTCDNQCLKKTEKRIAMDVSSYSLTGVRFRTGVRVMASFFSSPGVVVYVSNPNPIIVGLNQSIC